jgi:hypothetical protein
MLTLGPDATGDLPVGRQGPDRVLTAHRHTGGRARQPHGLIEVGKAQPQLAAVAAHAHHPPGLVGGDQHRQPQLVQKSR